MDRTENIVTISSVSVRYDVCPFVLYARIAAPMVIPMKIYLLKCDTM
jgi:hypothetical protein